jgi:hypothetical protein
MFHSKKKTQEGSPPPRSPPRTPAHQGSTPRRDAAATSAAVLPPPTASTPFATADDSTSTAAPPLPLSARTLERRTSLSSRPVDVLRAALAAQRNELISVFACLERKARDGGTPVLRPHVLTDECARLEEGGGGGGGGGAAAAAAQAPAHRADAPVDANEEDDYDDDKYDDASRASLAAVFRSCIEVLVVLPPENGDDHGAAAAASAGAGAGATTTTTHSSPPSSPPPSRRRAPLPCTPAGAIDAASGAATPPGACTQSSCAPCGRGGGGGSTATRVALALRLRPGVCSYVYFRGASSVEELTTSQYLALKERLATDAERADERRRAAEAKQGAAAASSSSSATTHPPPTRHPSLLPPLEEADNPFAVLEIDLAPFNRDIPKLRMPGSIGDGVRFLNRYLSAQLFQRPADGDDPLFGGGGGFGGDFGGGGGGAPLGLASSPTFARRALSGAYAGAGGGFFGGAAASATTPTTSTSTTTPGVMQGALTQGKVQLCNFLRSLRAPSGESLLVCPRRVDSPGGLANALLRADRRLDPLPDDAPWSAAAPRMSALGLERGWGATVAGVRDMMRTLLDVLEAPSADALERFLSRLPLVTDVAILSPHGYFGQDDSVLGKPDTGGQVVYLVDVTKGLEREMRRRLAEQGLADVEPRVVIVTRLIPDAPADTTCAQRLEPVIGTESAVILRVPFRTADGRVLRQWVSRFDVAPYLERFALDVERELLAMLGRPPSLIIGNYTDGGMVATLLEQRMGGASIQW